LNLDKNGNLTVDEFFEIVPAWDDSISVAGNQQMDGSMAFAGDNDGKELINFLLDTENSWLNVDRMIVSRNGVAFNEIIETNNQNWVARLEKNGKFKIIGEIREVG